MQNVAQGSQRLFLVVEEDDDVDQDNFRQQEPRRRSRTELDNGTEWPTLFLLTLCYAAWLGAIGPLSVLSLPAGIVAAALAGTLHASLQHEAIHGHPFRDARWNAALVFRL